jgi:hypothetical protein
MTKYIAGSLVALLAVGACNPNAALRPKTPDVVTTIGPQSLPGLYIGALGDFRVAWSGAGDQSNGGHEGHIGMSAIFTDELTAANLDEFIGRRRIDHRVAMPVNGQLGGIFNDLSTSRLSSEATASSFRTLAPKDLGFAEVMVLNGYTYVLFAEMWCPGVPFSELKADGSPDYGLPLTTGAMDTIALRKFDSASTLAAADTNGVEILAVSQLGRARVLLDLGLFAAAGRTADSALVMDPALAYQLENSQNTTRQFNGVWHFVQGENDFGVVDRKGGNGLDFISAQDPRILWVDAHRFGQLGQAAGADTIYYQLKYPTEDASATLASALEATLISAEADLRAGNVPSWASKLNALRAASGLTQKFYDTVATSPAVVIDTIIRPLPQLTADSTTLAPDSLRVEVHFRERAFWLWLTGTRLGDLRRLLRQYNGGQWGTHNDFPQNEPGTDIRFPVPVGETNNPHFHQCLDVGSES